MAALQEGDRVAQLVEKIAHLSAYINELTKNASCDDRTSGDIEQVLNRSIEAMKRMNAPAKVTGLSRSEHAGEIELY